MRHTALAPCVIAACLWQTPALAGEVPLYQPAPAWVVPATLPAGASAADAPALALYDSQTRFEDGRQWTYADTATRIQTPEMLARSATITLPWHPDKGDLIIHELSILRPEKSNDLQTIDLLARGQKFTVLRREESLEQRELTGVLTATLAVEGVQVGDVVRIRMSTTMKDDALGGRVQQALPLLAAPLPVGTASLRMSWPTSQPLRWKVLAADAKSTLVTKGKYAELAVALPLIKQPEMPDDAPIRFQRGPMIEASAFTGWQDVSRTMAPLYATAGTIPPGSPLASEVATIRQAAADPLQRAAMALQLVQDKTRYLAVGMNGGNYVPQSPARTWELRYGDCKAKTLLLLAMLRALDIEAEPVVAHIGLDDLVPERVPSALAFNHIIVRAMIAIPGSAGGARTDVWLDGTANGTRLADVLDTPIFHHVLPLRTQGADLLTIVPRVSSRPLLDITVDANETTSVDLPSVVKITTVARGPLAAALSLASGQLGAKQKREALWQFLQGALGGGQFDAIVMTSDAASGTATITARGALNTPWKRDETVMKRKLSRIDDVIGFNPDRARAAWTSIPVGLPEGPGVHYRTTIHLPDGGRGFSIEGSASLAGTIGGIAVNRQVALAGAVATIDEVYTPVGGEIAADSLPLERERVAQAKAQSPRIVSPAGTRRRWDLAGDPVGATQLKDLETLYAHTVADAEPEDTSALTSRASFHHGIGDHRAAIADWSAVIAKAPDASAYLSRAQEEDLQGDHAAALADGLAALKLDPSSQAAVGTVAYTRAQAGKLAEALALIDERIAQGGEHKFEYRLDRASLLGEFGDPALALQEFDKIAAEKPGNPKVLNGRCWTKALREVALDTALKDCTSAIELSSDTAPVLDSRAVVWLRMKRYDEALRDLDAALQQSPDLASSNYFRALVLKRLGRTGEAAEALAKARRLSPYTETRFARYGLTI